MNKREERSHKFKLLFSTLFYEGEEKEEQISHYSFEKEEDDEDVIAFDCLPDEEKAYLETEVLKILERLPYFPFRPVRRGYILQSQSKMRKSGKFS